MYDIRLVNMPFANLHIPSLGLTQLASVVGDSVDDEVRVQVHYLNHDFAHFFGVEHYRAICALGEHQNSGVGDWFFRQVAFPDAEDNTDEFLRRYYPAGRAGGPGFAELLASRRDRLPEFLDELIDCYGVAQARLVGMTSMFAQNMACFALARRLKDQDPRLTTVIGGANCETPMGEQIVAHVPQIDFVFSGPALRSFPQLVNSLRADDRRAALGIHGVFHTDNLDRILEAGSPAKTHLIAPGRPVLPVGQELDVNTFIKLDYDSFVDDVARNFPDGEVELVLPFETSRGCWWGEKAHCTFCGLNSLSMNYRSMAADNAKVLLADLFARYGHINKQWICVDNILPREYLTDLFPSLVAPPDTTIFYEVKADLTDAEVAVLAQAGVTIVQPGIESLATSTLKLMKKGVSSFRNLRFLQSCLRHGVYPTWNLLVGFPGEDPEVYRKYVADLPNLFHLPPPTGVYPVRFDRYSPYFDQAEDYGLELEPLDFYCLTYPFPDTALRGLAYYFADHNYEAEYFAGMVTWLNEMRELTSAWRMRWHEKETFERPLLHVDEVGGAPAVRDTRSGQTVVHPLTVEEHELLRYLVEPRDPARLPRTADAERLERMRRRGWLFQDGRRVLTLVMQEPPSGRNDVISPVADFSFDVDVNDLLSDAGPARAPQAVPRKVGDA